MRRAAKEDKRITVQRETAQWVSLQMPPPISTNELFIAFNKGGKSVRVRSFKYQKWSREALAMIEEQNPARVEGPFGLRILLSNKCRMDISNTIKAYEDALVQAGICDDDRYCQRIEVAKVSDQNTTIQVTAVREVKS
jgi:Holliday junction resolvase RusA-like endonuclease